MRRDEEHILSKVLRADIPGKRKRGRPKTRWKDACKRDMKSTGLRWTGRHRVERLSAIIYDGKSQGKEDVNNNKALNGHEWNTGIGFGLPKTAVVITERA